jgi:hypothetical protein
MNTRLYYKTPTQKYGVLSIEDGLFNLFYCVTQDINEITDHGALVVFDDIDVCKAYVKEHMIDIIDIGYE